MSIASVQYFQLPAHTSAEAFVEGLKAYMLERIDLVPYLTNVPEWTDGAFGHPHWIKAEHFDINEHIYAVPVPAPGGRRQVEQTIAKLHEVPLPRHRPLWDVAVLTGLPNEQVVYYNRVHHACLDGVSAQASTQLLMEEDPTKCAQKQPIQPTNDAHHSLGEHLINLFSTMAKESIDRATHMPERFQAAAKVAQRSIHPTKGLGALNQTPPATRLNKSIDRGRTFVTAELPMKELRTLAKATHSSVNDVFLSVCGGALRRYLERHSANPEKPLIAGCPVSLRRPGDKSNNNQVTIMKVALGTDLEDPVDRLGAVRASARTAKQVTAEMAPLLAGSITAPGLGAATHNMAVTADLLPLQEWLGNPSINVLISNVPGPRKPLYSNGARMLTHYPVSIPTHGVGVNITVQSYVDQLYVGITACAKTMPDADLLRDDLLAEWDELYAMLTADVVTLTPESDTTAKAEAAESAPEAAAAPPVSAPVPGALSANQDGKRVA